MRHRPGLARFAVLARAHAGPVASVVVLAIVAKAILGRTGTFDLGFDDECYLLDLGLRLPAGYLPPPEYGPLYAIWYRVLAALEPDPTRLYTFNWVVLQIGLAWLLHALARRAGAPRLAAALVTLGWALGNASSIWPFAVYFSTGILALGAIAATYVRDRLVAATLIAIGAAAASFVRPELALPGLVLVAVVTAWSAARALRSRRPRALGAPLALAATIAVLVLAFGSPLGGDRSYFAFQQHYAWHRVEAEQLDADPWSGFQPVVAASFPHARSIAGAARENPAAFAWHVGHNLRLLPVRLGWFAELAFWVPQLLRVVLAWSAGAVLVVGALALVARWRQLSPRLVAWLPIWIPVGAGFAAAVLLIHPRDHYFVPFGFFAAATLASACGAIRWRPRRAEWLLGAAGLVAALTLLASLPTYRRGAFPALLEADGNPPPRAWEWEGRRAVETLRSLDLRGERVILSAEYGHAVYARIPFRPVAQGAKDRPFFDFLREHDVDVVIATPRILDDARYRDDPELQSFLADGGDHRGFVLRRVPHSRTIIAVLPR